jgi:hypothetical protein
MLLPAVQKVRESANNARCQNNLKQIGQSIHTFYNDYNILPPGGVRLVDPQGSTAQFQDLTARALDLAQPASGSGGQFEHASWIFLTPYLDHRYLYDQYDRTISGKNSANVTAVGRTFIKSLICPSSYPTYRSVTVTGSGVRGAAKDYAMIAGVSNTFSNRLGDNTVAWEGCGASSGSMRCRGPFQNSHVLWTIPQITDGMSNTLFVGEMAGRPDEYTMQTKVGNSLTSETAWIEQGSSQVITLDGVLWSSMIPPTASVSYTGNTTPASDICTLNCNNANEPYAFHFGWNGVYGDGHVGTFTQKVSIGALARLFTCIGNEAVNATDYE